MEPDFLEIINYIYDLAGIKILRTGPSLDNASPAGASPAGASPSADEVGDIE